jgi:hypothetical protein
MIEYPGSYLSKRSVFRNECGICGKPLRRNAKNKIGYICRKCGPKGRCEENNNCCSCCPFEMECTMRVQLGVWIICETPDIADLERLKFTGGLNDENILSEVDNALIGKGNRKLLEEAITRNVPKLYQVNSKKQIPIDLRDDL